MNDNANAFYWMAQHVATWTVQGLFLWAVTNWRRTSRNRSVATDSERPHPT